jgi:osmotically inducible lipoprotein OsmB
MRKFLMIGAAFAVIAATTPAQAASERTLTGVAIGAGTGALVAGPIGAVAGGVVGGIVGGPRVSRGHKECWYDRHGHRHCRWR